MICINPYVSEKQKTICAEWINNHDSCYNCKYSEEDESDTYQKLLMGKTHKKKEMVTMNENKKKEKIPTRKQLVKAYEYADEIEAMIHLNTIENKTKNLLWLKTYYKKIQMIGKIIAQCHNSIYFQECKKLLEERKKKKELE